MKMRDPIPQFSHFVSSLVESHPNLAFVHLVEPPPIAERTDVKHLSEIPGESNDFIRKIWTSSFSYNWILHKGRRVEGVN